MQKSSKAIIRIKDIQFGNSQQNDYVERFNKTVSYGQLSKNLFNSLEEISDYTSKQLLRYNYERPHKANNGFPPLKVA